MRQNFPTALVVRADQLCGKNATLDGALDVPTQMTGE